MICRLLHTEELFFDTNSETQTAIHEMYIFQPSFSSIVP